MAICAPLIAIAEIATAGGLSSAIGTALGSEILGGAVLGLIAAEGNPMGAIMGGLGAAVGGSLRAASAAAKTGTDALSNTAQLATAAVGNEGVSSSAATVAEGYADISNIGDVMNGSSAASAASQGGLVDALKPATTLGQEMGGVLDRNGSDVLSDLYRGGPGGPASENWTKAGDRGSSIFSDIEGFAEKHPTLTRAGLGMVQGLGQHLSKQSMLDDKYRKQRELEEERRRRAYSGINYLLPFSVNTQAYAQARMG